MTDPIDISDWILAQTHGLLVIGKQTEEDPLTLSPVYQVHNVMQGTPDGRINIGQQVLPLWNFASINRFGLGAGTAIMRVSDLSEAEQKQLGTAVAGCAEMMANMVRAQTEGPSRLVLPGPDARAMTAMRNGRS